MAYCATGQKFMVFMSYFTLGTNLLNVRVIELISFAVLLQISYVLN